MQSMPYLNQDQAGIGGQIKVEPDDFMVEEVPLYQAVGEGQHCYLLVEKRGISTPQLVEGIARALGVSPRSIGYAGLKDARAVTRQYISVDGIEPDQALALDMPQVKVLQAVRHRNKLKLGHLQGNRFTIRVRNVDPDSQDVARAVLSEMSRRGVPNYFGQQRFGNRGNTHLLGKALLQNNAQDFLNEYLGQPQPQERAEIQRARAAVDAGDYAGALGKWPSRMKDERRVLQVLVSQDGDKNRAMQALHKNMRRFAMSAYQSYLFNLVLSEKIQSIDQLETGDVAFIHASGGAFIVEDAQIEQARAAQFQISPSGPLFGPKLLQAQGIPGQRERAVLAESGLTLDQFRLPGIKQKGARRPMRVPLNDVEVGWDDGLMLQFQLPPGSYATGVLRELMKDD